MFQFAAAKSFAINNNATLKLDISSFKNKIVSETPRKWALNIFKNIHGIFADDKEIKSIVPTFPILLFERIYKISNKKISWLNKRHLLEKKISYAPYHFKKTNTYFEGYWQSFRYFEQHEDIIRHLFDLSYLQQEEQLREYIADIRSATSVSLHVRRGDYLINTITKNLYPVCDVEYYKKAIEYIRQAEKQAVKIFIFSDDIEWCKKNLPVEEEHIFIRTDTDAHDLYLMSICRHNIIANSSFSWWGAWLNTHSSKIVVAPSNWHKKFTPDDINNLLPKNWIKL
jgi:hemerythrin